jgi:hypothetical protein
MKFACLFGRHNWGDWAQRPGKCVEIRNCLSCGKKEDRDREHEWSQWETDPKDADFEVHNCRVCGRIEKRDKRDKFKSDGEKALEEWYNELGRDVNMRR